jgi:hypothetical protein
MLADRLEDLEKGEKSRSAVVGEVKRRKKSSAVKKSKRKYRKLDEAKAGIEDKGEADVKDSEGSEKEP